MTAASERRRAAIAVSGVTLVLLIAAGIHFIAPARRAERTIARSVEALLPQAPTAVTSSASSPAVESSDAQRPAAAAPQRTRAVTPRVAKRSADDRDTAGSSSAPADDPTMLAVPLVASLEIPENSLRVESLRMPVSADFVEPILPISESEPSGQRGSLARSERQRDPVTAAFVTAGNAVAGGFRSAGRALKRAF